MTLTLDDVRNMKFRIARRSGYEVLDVDQFVDRVEEAFAQLTEENEQLKRQVADLTEAAEASAKASEDRPAAEQPQAWAPPTPEPAPTPEPVAESSQPQGERIVVTTADEASPAVVRLVQLATEQAEQLVSEARDESDQILQKAQQEANGVTNQARSLAERLESEARLAADRSRNESEARSRAFDEELKERRTEAFSAMETERDQLREAVGELRNFEKSYRSNLTEHLKAQITGLENANLEPNNTPGLLQDSGQQGTGSGSGSGADSDTPRLDALLGGDR